MTLRFTERGMRERALQYLHHEDAGVARLAEDFLLLLERVQRMRDTRAGSWVEGFGAWMFVCGSVFGVVLGYILRWIGV